LLFKKYDDLEQFINENNDTEKRNYEFKSSNKWDGDFKYKIVRAILCMANKQDGGSIIIGVDENDASGKYAINGLPTSDAMAYKTDDVMQFVNEKYAEPSIDLTVQRFEKNGKELVNIHVTEFENEPILCKGDYNTILQKGRLYSRGHNKAECTPNLTIEDFREILDMAKTKAVAKEIQRLQSFGIIPKHENIQQQKISQTHTQSYVEEAKGFDD